MIAADTSSLVAYLQGELAEDTEAIGDAMEEESLVVAPVVVTELLSDYTLSKNVIEIIASFPTLDLLDGYWTRAGLLRAMLRHRRVKAKVGDCLIAQACLDHEIAVISRDRDFRHFVKYTKLKVVGI